MVAVYTAFFCMQKSMLLRIILRINSNAIMRETTKVKCIINIIILNDADKSLV